MSRRLAILDDNQLVLEARLAGLCTMLPALVRERISAAIVIGSVADGRARDTSDVDLVLVLRDGSPRRSDYTWWDRTVAPTLDTDDARFPVQPLIVGRSALSTAEPHLARALRDGIVLWDPEALLDDQSRPDA